jgi:hypothetical protein
MPSNPDLAPDPAAGEAAPGDDRQRRRWPLKKIFVPFLLLVLAGSGAVALYFSSSPGEPPSPSYATLALNSRAALEIIMYSVDQGSRSAEINIRVEVSATGIGGPAIATLKVTPPNGTSFGQCPNVKCSSELPTFSLNKTEPLNFTPGPDGAETARIYFRAKTAEFGDISNGLDASAAVPQLSYQCSCSASGAPVLEAQYNLPGAASYDWASFPTQKQSTTGATWEEPVVANGETPGRVTIGETPGRVATGVDFSTQRQDNALTFIAGALIGVAGGALLAVATEWSRASDQERPASSTA